MTFVCARLFGFKNGQALEMGLWLGQGGEFAFVAIALAVSLALIPEPTAQFMLIVVSVTMVLTPLVAHGAHRLGDRLSAEPTTDAEWLGTLPDGMRGHVLVIGYGRTGEFLCDVLEEHHFEVVALDQDPFRVINAFRVGRRVFVGDASRRSLLNKLSPETAVAIAVSTDDTVAAERILAAAQQLAPATPVLLRARDNRHARTLMRQGASVVVPEVQEAGLQIAAQLLSRAGWSGEAVNQLIEAHRLRLQHELNADKAED